MYKFFDFLYSKISKLICSSYEYYEAEIKEKNYEIIKLEEENKLVIEQSINLMDKIMNLSKENKALAQQVVNLEKNSIHKYTHHIQE